MTIQLKRSWSTVTGTVFICINWTSLESRLLDFYGAYVPSCKAQWPSPVSSWCIKMDSYWNAGCNGEFFVLAWRIKLSAHKHWPLPITMLRWQCPAKALWGLWSTLRSSDGACYRNAISLKKEEQPNLPPKGVTLYSGYFSLLGETF